MVKQILTVLGFSTLLSSCTVFKSLSLQSNKALPVTAPAENAPIATKFIENITVTPELEKRTVTVKKDVPVPATKGPVPVLPAVKEDPSMVRSLSDRLNGTSIETAEPLQFKYAILMNTEVETLPNKALLEGVDHWYGVRYRSGGNDHHGIDCSGFTVAVYTAVYGITLPRVSRDQYHTARKISTTELQEGDLVFFNTRGRGVSHVGIYLGNNFFIHASVSKGVMVSSLFEPYYLQRFVGAGRIDSKEVIASN